jgi:hypothetical protein
MCVYRHYGAIMYDAKIIKRNVGGVVNMVKKVERGMKVMLKNKEFIVGEKYNRREFSRSNEKAKGKVIIVNDKATDIFDTNQGFGVMHFEWVDELNEISLDNLVSAVISGGLSEEEYEVIRRERA